jgi:hypothetical protein
MRSAENLYAPFYVWAEMEGLPDPSGLPSAPRARYSAATPRKIEPSESAMIRHIVLVKFPATTRSDAIDDLFHALDDLRSVVPGMLHFFSGANISPESLARGFTHAFVADFKDVAARDAYLVHPAHKAAGARLVAAADTGIDGLIVVDIDIGG